MMMLVEIFLAIILFPFAVVAVVFTGALGVGLVKTAYSKILKVKPKECTSELALEIVKQAEKAISRDKHLY